MELRVSGMLGKHITSELQSQLKKQNTLFLYLIHILGESVS